MFAFKKKISLFPRGRIETLQPPGALPGFLEELIQQDSIVLLTVNWFPSTFLQTLNWVLSY